MAIEPTLAEEQLPDGVYIGLTERVYFAQNRLGSSDLMKLSKHKQGWWWQSRWNPDRKQDQTEAQNYGSALHKIMLEGMGAYTGTFLVEPDPLDFPDAVSTIPQMKAALIEGGFDLKGTSSYKADDWAEAMTLQLPAVPVWPNIMADFRKRQILRDAAGEAIGLKPSVSAVEDRMLRVMYDAAMGEDEIRGMLGAGQDVPTLAELSFFWHDRWGTPRRARFDSPVPTFTLDLKSLGNWQGRELEHSLGDHILREQYDVQCGDQHEARKIMHAMVAQQGDAVITGGTEEQRAWLKAIAERNLPWDWVWLFYQKPELSGRAPVLFPLGEKWGGLYHHSGYRRSVRAIEFFHEQVAIFGLGDRPAADGSPSRAWYRAEPLHWTDENETHHITVSHYGRDEVPVESEPEHMER